MKPSEVIKTIEAYYNLSGSVLAEELGLKHPSRVNDISSGRTKRISKDLYNRLMKRWPDLNPDFIMNGHEPMHLNRQYGELPGILTTAEMVELILQQYQLTARVFSQLCGWDESVTAGMRSGLQYKELTKQRITSITAAFPDISPLWLASGRGTMFVNGRALDETLPMPEPIRSKAEPKPEAQHSPCAQPSLAENPSPSAPTPLPENPSPCAQPSLAESELSTLKQENHDIKQALRLLNSKLDLLLSQQSTGIVAEDLPSKS